MSKVRHYKDLLKLGLPIMAGQLGMIVLGFADTMMVGRCGTEELAAAGFVNNVFNLLIVFSTGFSYGLTPLVGSMYGKSDETGIARALKNSLYVNLLVSIGLCVFMALIYMNVHRLGQPEELLPLIRPYFLVLLASLIPVLVFNAFKQFSEGINDTLTPMCVLIAGNILNIAGNWLLIFGKCGLPEMGLLGAGIATLSSRIIMLLAFMLIFFLSARYEKYRKAYREVRLEHEMKRRLFRLGLPVGLQMGMETASFSLSTIMVGWLGTVALAAHQVMMTVGQLGFMIYYGMAAAVAVKVSNYIGEENKHDVREVAGSGFRLILVMAAVTSACILLSRNMIGYIFSESSEVAVMVARIVIPFVLYQFGDGLQCNYSNALRGISDVKMLTVYAFVAYFLISLPAAYLFAFVFDMGLFGIWLSFPFGLTSAGLLFRHRFVSSLSRISF